MSGIFFQDLEDLKHWLTSAWFNDDIEDSPYQAALRLLILQLWPKIKENTDGSGTDTFLTVPVLCYRALGGTSNVILPINCAWILLYAAFYLLDKVEDQETGQVLYSPLGVGPLTNLTTGLILNAGEILTTAAQVSPQMDRICKIQMDFYRMAADVCAGQHLDLTTKEPELSTAWEIASNKSGNFFSLGCRMGASLSEANPGQVDALARYGYHLGTLIQIANDYDGLFPNEYGKSDIITGKFTLPIVYSFNVLPYQEREALRSLLTIDQADTQDKNQALQIIVQSGALLYLYLEAEKQKILATNAIENLALVPEIKEILLSIPEKIVGGLQRNGT
jgi:hypothetical protein